MLKMKYLLERLAWKSDELSQTMKERAKLMEALRCFQAHHETEDTVSEDLRLIAEGSALPKKRPKLVQIAEGFSNAPSTVDYLAFCRRAQIV